MNDTINPFDIHIFLNADKKNEIKRKEFIAGQTQIQNLEQQALAICRETEDLTSQAKMRKKEVIALLNKATAELMNVQALQVTAKDKTEASQTNGSDTGRFAEEIKKYLKKAVDITKENDNKTKQALGVNAALLQQFTKILNIKAIITDGDHELGNTLVLSQHLVSDTESIFNHISTLNTQQQSHLKNIRQFIEIITDDIKKSASLLDKSQRLLASSKQTVTQTPSFIGIDEQANNALIKATQQSQISLSVMIATIITDIDLLRDINQYLITSESTVKTYKSNIESITVNVQDAPNIVETAKKNIISIKAAISELLKKTESAIVQEKENKTDIALLNSSTKDDEKIALSQWQQIVSDSGSVATLATSADSVKTAVTGTLTTFDIQTEGQISKVMQLLSELTPLYKLIDNSITDYNNKITALDALIKKVQLFETKTAGIVNDLENYDSEITPLTDTLKKAYDDLPNRTTTAGNAKAKAEADQKTLNEFKISALTASGKIPAVESDLTSYETKATTIKKKVAAIKQLLGKKVSAALKINGTALDRNLFITLENGSVKVSEKEKKQKSGSGAALGHIALSVNPEYTNNGYLKMKGQQITRSAYPDFFTALSITGDTYTLTAPFALTSPPVNVYSKKKTVKPRADTWYGIAVDSEKNVYILDYYGKYAVYDSAGTLKKTVNPGDGTWYKIAVDSEKNVYVLDSHGKYVVYDSAGTLKKTVKLGAGNWISIAVDSDRNVYVLGDNSKYVIYDSSGKLKKTVNRRGGSGIAVDSEKNVYFVGNRKYVIYDSAGTLKKTVNIGDGFWYRIAVDSEKNVYVMDYNGKYAVYDSAGTLKKTVNLGSGNWIGIAVDSEKNVYVMTYNKYVIYGLSPIAFNWYQKVMNT